VLERDKAKGRRGVGGGGDICQGAGLLTVTALENSSWRLWHTTYTHAHTHSFPCRCWKETKPCKGIRVVAYHLYTRTHAQLSMPVLERDKAMQRNQNCGIPTHIHTHSFPCRCWKETKRCKGIRTVAYLHTCIRTAFHAGIVKRQSDAKESERMGWERGIWSGPGTSDCSSCWKEANLGLAVQS